MCKRFVFVNFSTNNSNKSSIIKYDFIFEIEKNVDDEIDEQIFNAIFAIIDIRFDVKIEKRENFDAMTERETISAQNIDFFDVATDKIDEIIKKILKNEFFEIISEKIINDVNINVDSLRENDVAKKIDIAIITFDVSINETNDCFDI